MIRREINRKQWVERNTTDLISGGLSGLASTDFSDPGRKTVEVGAPIHGREEESQDC